MGRFDSLYNLLIGSLHEEISIIKAAKEQNEMIEKINELGNFVQSEEKSINEEKSRCAIKKANTKSQIKEIISSQKSVINNAIKLHDKRAIIIDAFVSKNILPANLKKNAYQQHKRPSYEESIAERAKMRRQN